MLPAPRRRLFVVAASIAIIFSAATQLSAQGQPVAAKTVRGSVSRAVGEISIPLKGSQVVLHRIGTDSSGAVDSTKTNAAGEFRLSFNVFGVDNPVYLVSVTHAGIAYFSSELHAADLDSAIADIVVFDTTTARVPLSVAGRHLVVFAPVIGGRRVVEVYELSNDSTVTRVSRGDDDPVWHAPLPPGARDFGSGPGPVSPEALKFKDGEVLVFAPLPPGGKQISFAYTLPDGAFPLLFEMESATGLMEILLAEHDAGVDGGELTPEGVVDIQGKSFKRYVAFDLPAGTEFRVTVPAGSPLMVVLLIVGVGMLVALAVTFRRRAPANAAATVAARDAHAGEAEVLARRIAELDAEYGGRKSPDEKANAAYTAERNQLKKQLAALLARRSGPG